MKRRRLRLGLFARVILHGLLLLGASAAGFLLIASFLIGPPKRHQLIHAWIATEACHQVARAAGAAEAITLPPGVAVFSAVGEVLASSPPTHPFTPLDASEWGRLREGEVLPPQPGIFATVLCPGGDRYAVVGAPGFSPKRPLGAVGLLIFGTIVVVMLGSLPSARSLVRPLRELVTVAERFGGGDMTARARIDRTDEIGDLARAFNAMATNLHAHLLAEKELLANVSHELRTPLARVRVVLEMAREDPARAAALLTEIARDLHELERLTDDVLATLRLDFAGPAPDASVHFRPELVFLVPLLHQVVMRCAETYDDRDLIVRVEGELPTLEGDPALLRRLFENLLDNALKYSNQEIKLRANYEAGFIVVEIEDRGIGIESADLERIFEPFFRSARTERGVRSGSGIGLALCRRVVDVHGGSIDVDSSPSMGTVVTVRLPIDRAGSVARRSAFAT
jgi:signal transduction histidine kinase